MSYLNPHTHDLDDALSGVKVRFWLCPVVGHRDRRDSKGYPVEEVEWVDGVASCLFPGCGRTSADQGEQYCACDEYVCAGECCGPGQCSCS